MSFGFGDCEDCFGGGSDGSGVEVDLVAGGNGGYVDVFPEAFAERRGFVAGLLRGADVFGGLDLGGFFAHGFNAGTVLGWSGFWW